MFTGLVEEVGSIKSVTKKSDGMILKIGAKKVLEDVKIGDSIAVNGICLTVVEFTEDSLTFEVSNETIRRTNLKTAKVGDKVNLERALTPSSRFGGHLVQGHIDTEGKIVSLKSLGKHTELVIDFPSQYENLVIEKGSIAVDGISLTINQILQNKIFINIIPHTLENTNLKFKKVGDTVNIEFDLIGKYILKMISSLDINKNTKLLKLLEEYK